MEEVLLVVDLMTLVVTREDSIQEIVADLVILVVTVGVVTVEVVTVGVAVVISNISLVLPVALWVHNIYPDQILCNQLLVLLSLRH